MMNSRLAVAVSWIIVPFLFALDQWSKNEIIAVFLLGESDEIWGNIIRFTRVHNPGAAFGIFQDYPFVFTLLTGSAIFFVTLHKGFTTDRSWPYQISLGLVLAGALGNMTDRIRFNHVVDFLDIGIGDARWPAFNVADSCITVGVVILVLSSFFTAMPSKAENSEEPEKSDDVNKADALKAKG